MNKKMEPFKDQSKEELVALERDLAHEIFKLNNTLRFERKLEKPHLLKAKKRDRARVLTLLCSANHLKNRG
jgi:large subunit ribosomal protein L29